MMPVIHHFMKIFRNIIVSRLYAHTTIGGRIHHYTGAQPVFIARTAGASQDRLACVKARTIAADFGETSCLTVRYLPVLMRP